MKNSVLFSVLCCAATASFAQGSTGPTIYGLLDVGFDITNNVNGESLSHVNTGVLVPNILGFRGSEDLGGGLKAFYTLQTQFALDNGATIGDFFGHAAYVGLESSWGKVSVGNQDTFMYTNLSAKRYGQTLGFVSLPFLRQGPFSGLTSQGSFDFDHTGSTSRVKNSVRYDSPRMNGFSFGGMYGFGENAGSTSQGSTVSLGADYVSGPWTFTAAMVNEKLAYVNNGNDGLNRWGVGGRYDITGTTSVDFLYTNTKNTQTDAKIDMFEVGAQTNLTPMIRASGQYSYMKGNAQLNDNKAHQINAGLHYLLSKRSNVYVQYGLQKASGDGARAQMMLSGGASSGSTQSVIRLGMVHFF